MTNRSDGRPETPRQPSPVEAFGYHQELKRSLSMLDLLVYGLVFIVPGAPITVFGIVFNASSGMVPLVYIVGLLAMLFTAASYVTMSRAYPVAGSVYAYAGRAIGESVGFLAGWAMLLDYLLLPTLVYVLCAIGVHAVVQAIEKGRGFPPSPLPTHPHFQLALGKAELELASARALGLQVLSSLWQEARAGRVPQPSKQAEVRAAGTYITEVTQRVVTAAFQAAGGGALFDANPLQRCFRDIYAAGQHFMMSQTSYRALGQFKLDQPDANPML